MPNARQDAQTELRYRFEKSVRDYHVVAATSSSGTTVVSITGNGALRQITVPIGRLVDIFLPSPNRLLLVGDEHIAIIDPTTGTLIDHFWTDLERVAVSPSARLIAYLPPAPEWRRESSVYLIYDVERSPPDNRMPNQYSAPDWGPMNLDDYVTGWALYPLVNVHAKLYRRSYIANQLGSVRSEIMDYGSFHIAQSPLSWISDTRLAFVDNASHTSRIVVVDLSDGIDRPHVVERAIDVDALIEPERLRENPRPYGQDAANYLTARTITQLPDRAGAIVLKIEWAKLSWMRVPETVITLPR